MDAAQEKEIEELKAKLQAAEAKIQKLSASEPGPQWKPDADAIGEQAIEESRFPLFRQVQASVSKSYLDYVESKKEQGAPDPSVEQVFSKYDVDRSGLLDIDEFREMAKEMNLPVDLSVPDFGAMAGDAAKSAETFASDLAKDTAKSAETLVSDTARSADDLKNRVVEGVSSLAKGVNDLAASAGVPGATASVPVTLVGGLGSGYKEILTGSSLGGARLGSIEPSAALHQAREAQPWSTCSASDLVSRPLPRQARTCRSSR